MILTRYVDGGINNALQNGSEGYIIVCVCKTIIKTHFPLFTRNNMKNAKERKEQNEKIWRNTR